MRNHQFRWRQLQIDSQRNHFWKILGVKSYLTKNVKYYWTFTFEDANFIMDETELDDQLYKYLADHAKKEIPGHDIEPIAGKMLEGIGKELQKPLETDE